MHPEIDRDQMTPQQAVEILQQGNERFVNNVKRQHDMLSVRDELKDKLENKLENKVKERTRSLSTNVEKLEKINQQLDEENKKRIEAEQKAKVALKKERELNELKTNFLSIKRTTLL